MNAATLGVMKGPKTKSSFTISDRRDPAERLAERERVKAKRTGECRQPTFAEIADLALDLAREDRALTSRIGDLGPWAVQFFFRRAGAPPCTDPRGILLQPFIARFTAEAEERLHRHYEYYHFLDLKRKRWLRAHPRPRRWIWTRKPLKHAVPPPRRRMFHPPGTARPDRGRPPPPPFPEGSPKHPCRWRRETLLCYDSFFGN